MRRYHTPWEWSNEADDGYSFGVLLILVACVLAVIGLVQLARTLEPRQRVVLVLVVILGVTYLILKLMQLGWLGQRAVVAPAAS